MEAIEHAGALGGRDPGAIVGHREARTARVRRGVAAFWRCSGQRPRNADIDAPPRWGVAHGVVYQVAQQCPQRVRVAGDGGRLCRGDTQVDAPRVCERHELRHDLAREPIEAHRHPRAVGTRLLAREHEHLLDEMNGALHARGECAHRGLTLAFTAGTREHPHLQVERGERSAQLVRCIGHEGALALGRLRAALERERAFMADAAHELRTPLTALHLQVGMLTRASSEGEREAAMSTLAAGVQRAIHLVEQMLVLARQEPRAVSPRVPVRLDELARGIVAELVPLADAGYIDLGVAAAQPATITGDPDAVRTLLRNLVDNAVRYTPAGGRVDVTAESTSGSARLTVTDDGPGIPPEERTRVFDRFHRPAGTAPPGSGLGLAIVKAIAEAHGATVSLAPGPSGKGLAVTVVFPAQPPVPATPQDSASQA